MTKAINATYDPSKKWKPIEEGSYPAHVKSISSREINTRAGEAIVVNMKYKIADEVTKTTQPVWQSNNEGYSPFPVPGSTHALLTQSFSSLESRDFTSLLANKSFEFMKSPISK